jgi:hypothetical protein
MRRSPRNKPLPGHALPIRLLPLVLPVLFSVATAACREPDGPLEGSAGKVFVDSDPVGGHIYLDDNDTGLRTPDTVPVLGSAHTIVVLLDTAGSTYSYGARIAVQGSEPFVLTGPLTTACGPSQSAGSCFDRNRTPVTAGNLQLSMNALGAVLLQDGSGQGLLWPAGTSDSYVSNGMPLIAGKVEGRSVALGMYDVQTLAGRPALNVVHDGGATTTNQTTWIVPLPSTAALTTIRGIEVHEQVRVDPSQPDVALVRLTYRNITNSPMYQSLDGRDLGASGVTYTDVYLGFGLDPDVGDASDDLVSYDPDLKAVFAYDAEFSESAFSIESATRPGLIGLRMLSAPSGASVILNGYGTQGGAGSVSDWQAGTSTEVIGWQVLSGTSPYDPDDPDPTIGMLVPDRSDVRIMVSAGPYTLRPADEITVVVAVALARPVAGTFTSGQFLPPGDPHDPTRPIMKTAAALLSKLDAASALLPLLGN